MVQLKGIEDTKMHSKMILKLKITKSMKLVKKLDREKFKVQLSCKYAIYAEIFGLVVIISGIIRRVKSLCHNLLDI